MRKLHVVLANVAVLFAFGCGGGGTAQSPPLNPPATVAKRPPTPSTFAGTFSPIGNMTMARAEHTATLLPSGKVLIAGGFGVTGGFGPQNRLASAELYDPSTATFTATGTMTTPRARHTAVLLGNGKVLVAGGVIDTQTGIYDPSAELYDPTTGTFTAMGSMISSGNAFSTLLQDGRVLISKDGSAEIYDPAVGSFAPTGAYVDPNPVQPDTATLLLDGRVLVTGCAANPTICGVDAAEIYDPQTGTFSRTGHRHIDPETATAILLLDGGVLSVEGTDTPNDYAEVYDPAAGAFTSIGYTNTVHWFSAAVRFSDGTVLIAGGEMPGGSGNPTAELYSPGSDTFAVGTMTMGRHSNTATLLPNGTVLIAGGFSNWPLPTASAEIYRP
jgi:hypothetical protein